MTDYTVRQSSQEVRTCAITGPSSFCPRMASFIRTPAMGTYPLLLAQSFWSVPRAVGEYCRQLFTRRGSRLFVNRVVVQIIRFDVPIAHPHDALRPGRDIVFMRDHDDGLAGLVQIP